MGKARYKEYLTKEGLLKLEGWARDGLTDEQIADSIGIKRPTIYEWKKKYPDIADALKAGKEVIDRKVENSLLKRALGTKTSNITYKMVKVDDDVLKVRRVRFLNDYKLKHPDVSKQELTMIAVDKVPTYERIPIVEVQNELPPDVSAQIFWLKNRKPELYRDQSFRELNNAQTVKAKAEAKIAVAKAQLLSDDDNSNDRTIIVDDIGSEEDE